MDVVEGEVVYRCPLYKFLGCAQGGYVSLFNQPNLPPPCVRELGQRVKRDHSLNIFLFFIFY